MATPYYINGVITGVDDLRWNRDDPLGTPGASVDYSFFTAVPDYANKDIVGDAEGDATPATFVAFDAAQRVAAASALGKYAEIAHITFHPLADDAEAPMHFGTTVMDPGTLAYAYYPYPDFEQGGDVWLGQVPGSFELQPGEQGYSTLIHEIGHALGLKHPFDKEQGGSHQVLHGVENTEQYTVMAYNLYRHSDFYTPGGELHQIEASTPMLYDVAAIQYLYGANRDTRAGDDVYRFSPDDPFLECLWDGAGNDTISVRSFALGCNIDLRAGHFSDITILSAPGFGGTYDGAGNLSIAFGCLIENATGGAGADSLRGNAAGNVLLGGAGNDTLIGGGGGDLLVGGSGDDSLLGGAGDDTLVAGGRNDLLLGNAGADVFAFAAPAARHGTIADFTPGTDHLQIDASTFPGLEGLSAEQMFADHLLVYDAASGKLYYDADGDGSGRMLLAQLTGHPALGAGDVTVV